MVAHNSIEQQNNLRPMTPALPVRCDGLSSRLNWWVQTCSKGSGLTWARPEKIHSVEAYHMCGTFLGATTTSATSEERWRLCMDVLRMCPNIGGWVALYRFIFMAQFEAFWLFTQLCLTATNVCIAWEKPSSIHASQTLYSLRCGIKHASLLHLGNMKRHATSWETPCVQAVNVKALGCGEHQISRSSVENDSHFLRWSPHLQHLNKVILSKFNVKQGRLAGLLWISPVRSSPAFSIFAKHVFSPNETLLQLPGFLAINFQPSKSPDWTSTHQPRNRFLLVFHIWLQKIAFNSSRCRCWPVAPE